MELQVTRTGAADDTRPEPPARWDHEVARDNKRRYLHKRGRVCRFEGCETKLRYTRTSQYCSAHELTDEAQEPPKPGPPPGKYRSPLVPGLRAARKARKIPTKDLAAKIGRGVIWLQRAERGAHGAPDDVRAKLCEVLGVSEAELFAGEFKRRESK